ncbi:MAG: 2-C-methyl-D-erythritol 4-phosphate cytidylyltransferase [Actinomycetota bacterium]|jgi:2-C-methyl-D-erythritol 4-phosphate cytidylyltransferase|nr:2-C-methyl-D-erythritol 4-phosphate cytidylyltransferase [Actinomycetota bacterium]
MSASRTRAVALVLAGGTGSRMGRPKQFIELLGRPALFHTLAAFQNSPEVEKIYTVGEEARISALAREHGVDKYAGCAEPGESRPLSTKSGLLLCDEDPETIVLIHDGSRCLVTPDLIGRIIEAVENGADGAIPATPVSDTIKVASGDSVAKTLDRSELRAVQTPQAFRLGLLRELFADREENFATATDDAYLVERAGGEVRLVEGERSNIKLTSPEDVVLAEAILTARAGRAGERFGLRAASRGVAR